MYRVHSWVLVGTITLFAVGFCAGETVAESGTLAGTVTYSGTVPAAKELQISKDQEICGKEPHYDESLIVAASKGIKNVVVSIANISKGGDLKSLGTDFSLRQTGCVFSPHVQLVPVGVPLKVFNNDGILHNIHTYSERNPSFNVAQPKFLKKIERTFNAAERVSMKCDVHGWMNAFIVVVDHPYHAVTDANGQYTITGVPAGSYQVEFWHEKLGKNLQEAKVAAGAETRLNFVFPAAKK
jgi:plastocyanin